MSFSHTQNLHGKPDQLALRAKAENDYVEEIHGWPQLPRLAVCTHSAMLMGSILMLGSCCNFKLQLRPSLALSKAADGTVPDPEQGCKDQHTGLEVFREGDAYMLSGHDADVSTHATPSSSCRQQYQIEKAGDTITYASCTSQPGDISLNPVFATNKCLLSLALSVFKG